MGLEAMTTVEKAIDVLFHLSGSPGPLGVSAIGNALGMPKSSTHRLLAALARRGLVEREGRGLYRPGIGLVALGLGVLDRDPVVAAARPVLEAAAEKLGETFFLVAARAGQLVVLDKAEGSGVLRAAPRIGSRVPRFVTAVGKLHAAFAPDSLLGGDASEAPSVDPGDFASEVEIARSRGWAANRDEWITGMSVLAAPILVGTRMLGAVALAAASPRLEELGGDSLATRVIEAAAETAARMKGESA